MLASAHQPASQPAGAQNLQNVGTFNISLKKVCFPFANICKSYDSFGFTMISNENIVKPKVTKIFNIHTFKTISIEDTLTLPTYWRFGAWAGWLAGWFAGWLAGWVGSGWSLKGSASQAACLRQPNQATLPASHPMPKKFETFVKMYFLNILGFFINEYYLILNYDMFNLIWHFQAAPRRNIKLRNG